MTKRQKSRLVRIIVSASGLMVLWLLPAERLPVPLWCLYLIPYLIAGYNVLVSAGRNIIRGNVFDEKFLMSLATLGAFAIGEYPEAVFVKCFFRSASCSSRWRWGDPGKTSRRSWTSARRMPI